MATYRSGLELEDPTGLGGASEGIKTLAGAIMPDPSKMAQAGYYGTRAREALINSAEKTSQMNMQPRFFGAIPGSGVGPVGGRYVPAPGIVNGPMMFQPDSTNIQAAPPSSLGVLVSGQGQQPGPVGPPLMPPGQVAQGMSQPNTPVVNTGSPPPASPPTPGSPPAPNTTTTNGQVPQNDAQGVHPGSFTENNGGQKMSGPAGPDGSPAPITPAIANFMAMGAAAGMSPEHMKMIGAAYVNDWMRTGAMDQNTGARTLAAIFDPSRIFHEGAETERKVIGEQGMTTRTGMEVQGRTTVANITEGGARYRHDKGTVEIEDPEHPGQKKIIYNQDVGPQGKPGYDPQTALGRQTATNALVDVPDPKGGYQKVPRSRALAENLTIVDPKVAQDAMEYVTVTTKDGSRQMRRFEAVQQGLAPAPTNTTQLQAEAGATAGARGGPVGPAIAAATPPAATSPNDAFLQAYNRKQNWQTYYPPSTALLSRNADGGVLPVGALAGKVDARAAQIKAQTNLDDAAAHAQAIRDMQESGELPSAADVDANRPSFVNRFTTQIGPGPDGKKYLYIDTATPAGDVINGAVKPTPTGPVGPRAAQGVGRTKPPTAPSAPVARAPNMADGATAQYTAADGTKKTGVVRGGLVYPQ